MKICFVSHASNYHTKKWAGWFASRGHEVHVISFSYEEIPGAHVHSLSSNVGARDSDLKKLGYLVQAKKLKEIIQSLAPDIVNVHYASSYGTLAALSGIHNYVLSVWGSDVYDFPKKSALHRTMIKYSLKKAGFLFSTSEAMALETAKYTNKPFKITPFGVNMEMFNPDKRTRELGDNLFVVGTVKALEPKYGIATLLEAVSLVRKERQDIPIQLRIAGRGSHEQEYKILAENLGIDRFTKWLGFISQEQVAVEWANMDVGIIPSELESESFGVSAVEAEACGVPVIISDIPGLMEATEPGKTSVVFKRKDKKALAEKIIKLFDSPEERLRIGRNGRSFVLNRFEIDKCFSDIEQLFFNISKQTGEWR